MSASENLETLKAAYAEWDRSKGEDTRMWLDLASENARILSLGSGAQPLQFAEPRGGAALVGYLEKLLETWKMKYFEPEIFVAEDDDVAMFGTASWEYRANGAVVTTPIAHLWRFENGKVVELRELFDSALILSATN